MTEIVRAVASLSEERAGAEASPPVKVSLHRAIDMTPDLLATAKTAFALGVVRILSSGGARCAAEGVETLRSLVEWAARPVDEGGAGGGVTVIPGAGVSEGNVAALLRRTGACCFHTSARTQSQSGMKFRPESRVAMGTAADVEFVWSCACQHRIKEMLLNAKDADGCGS
mmetsp:Transcript_14282/g.40562  ORF Transcript_14282/g.40562 Transcript_14282/m.40562 type:complete len:170 (-) Transcript_14282:2373-2882(-)